MSSDDATFIAVVEFENKKEYYVSQLTLPLLENPEYFSRKKLITKEEEEILKLSNFRYCIPYSNLEEAIGVAFDFGPTEYGIRKIYFNRKFPTETEINIVYEKLQLQGVYKSIF